MRPIKAKGISVAAIGLLLLSSCGGAGKTEQTSPAPTDKNQTAEQTADSESPATSKPADPADLKPVDPNYDGSEPSGNNPQQSELKKPEVPSVSEPSDQAGLTKFAEGYVKAAEYASMTGDLSQLKELSAKDCDACTQIMDSIKGAHNGGKYESGSSSEVKLVSIQVEDGTPKVAVSITNQESVLKDARNPEDVIPLPGEKTQWTYTFVKENGVYKVKQIEAILEEHKNEGQ